MGQKVNPHGLRVGVIKNWDSRWFAKDEVFGDTLVSDYNIRKYLKKSLQDAGVPKIEIERDSHRVRVFIHCAKPGMVIGRGGSEIEKYKNELEKMVKMPVSLNVVEVRQPDLDAQLVAEADAHTYPQQQQQDDQQQKYAQYPQCDQQGPPFLLFSLRRQVPLVVQAHLAVGLQPRHLRQILQ